MDTQGTIIWKRRRRVKQRIERLIASISEKRKGRRAEIFAAGVIANVAWNAICSRDVGFSFDDSRYPRYTCPWQIARETVRINCLHERLRRLHTHSRDESIRLPPPFFPPPDAILRIFSYRELHSLPFHLPLADTCDDSLSPSTQTPPPILPFFLSSLRSSIVGLAGTFRL